MPTSRATRVTSEAKPRSWSTIVLIACLSCRISPRTSTVIFRDRSPLATAIVTSAMLRTCAVRFDAIWLTESVRSFHTPDTPLALAWPPSRPSVPTSRATRVTSELNSVICSIIRLTMFAARRNSPCSGRPFASSGTVRERSPLATLAIASVIVSIGRIRSSIRPLTDCSMPAHAPCRFADIRRWRVWPRRPTLSPTRARSSASRRLCETISLKRSARRPVSPSQCTGSWTEKSPALTACIASSRSSSGSAGGPSLRRRTGLAMDIVDLPCGRRPGTAAMRDHRSRRAICMSSRATHRSRRANRRPLRAVAAFEPGAAAGRTARADAVAEAIHSHRQGGHA